jgi:hypothetical protein
MLKTGGVLGAFLACAAAVAGGTVSVIHHADTPPSGQPSVRAPMPPAAARAGDATDDAGAREALELRARQEAALEHVNRITSAPWIQAYVGALSGPRAQEMAEMAGRASVRWKLLGALVAWFLAMVILRAWRRSRARGWIGALWVSAWTFALFALGALLGIPWLVLGPQYVDWLQRVARGG